MSALKKNTVSNTDIMDFLTAIITFSKENKQNLDSLSKEYLKCLEQTVAYIEQNHAKVLDTIKSEKNAMVSDFELNLALLKDLLAEVKRIKRVKGKDGKDADEEVIISKVLEQIKLPEYKETVLDDGEEIVAKINDLPITPENQIDASHIKNLPTGGKFFGGGVNIKEIIAGDNVTIDNSNLGYPVINASGGSGISETLAIAYAVAL